MKLFKKLTCVILAFALAFSGTAFGENSNYEIAEKVLSIVQPYYEASKEIAINSPDVGRYYTDHKLDHALMCTEKSLEAGQALKEAVLAGIWTQEPEEGRIPLGPDPDFRILEAAGLSHDTGMNGHGYAVTEIVNEEGLKEYEKDEEGYYILHPEDNNNFQEIRANHPLVSALNVLINRDKYKEAGFSDTEVDEIAIICMAHSKSNSGVRDLNRKADWTACFDRLDSLVKYYNLDHGEEPITFDRAPFEADDTILSRIATESLAIRVGDVSRDSHPNAQAQSGENIYVDRSTIDDHGGSIEAEMKPAVMVIGENGDPVTNLKSLQVHAGEQNIINNHTHFENGQLVREITVQDGCSAPKCTQEAISDHLGELYSARDEWFVVNIIFQEFDAEDPEYFRESYEEFRMEAAQSYPNITLQYPWDQEVEK